MVDLSMTVAGVHFSRPVVLASGVMDEDAGSMIRMVEGGAAGVVTKSIGLIARTGHCNPTVVEVQGGWLNAMGLPNPGIDEYVGEIAAFKKVCDVPVIGSIFGANAEEFCRLARRMQQSGVQAIELNVSCPHAKGFGLQLGCDSELVEEIVSAVKSEVSLPVFVKLSPNVTDIVKIGCAAVDGGADGLVAINTIKAMAIDINLRTPVLSNRIGGLCGPAIKPVGIRCIYELFEAVDVPLIGVGGVSSGRDLIEYVMAGASLVQLGIGVAHRGISVFSSVVDEATVWMKDNEIESLAELVGVAH